MNSVSNEQLIENLQWRYATKVFDSSKKISEEDWKTLEESLVLTPSSYGLQPWKFLVVTSIEIKSKLLPISWNQKQVVDCSHFVVLTIKKDLKVKDIDKLIQKTVEARSVPAESLNFYRKMMVSDLIKGPRSQIINEWATRQVYIALGNLMTSAAMLGIDTCPMEGIEPDKYDQALGLEDKGLATVVACAVGYRDESDKYAHLPKVRYDHQDVIEKL